MGQAGSNSLRSATDAALIMRIASGRDQKAFEELLRRYEQSAYRLALRISNRPQTAEDAVQEAMIKVWQSAATFEPATDETCKAWIMKIVANQTLSVLRREARHSKRMMVEATSEARTENRSRPEVEEALEALTGALGTLSRRDQQIIALSFGGGMSNREIGEALSMPHTTVGYRIQTALEGLRDALSRAGILGAAGVTLPGLLSDAVLAGHGAPVNLRGRILEQIAGPDPSVAAEAARQSVRAAAQSKGAYVFWAILLFGTAAIAALWWKPVKVTPPSMPAVVPAATPEEEESRLIARWSFEQGPAEDLRIVQSNWAWEDGKKKGGAMLAGVNCNVMLELPVKLKPQPIKVTLSTRSFKNGIASTDTYWSNHESLISNEAGWVSPRNLQTTGAINSVTYIFDRYIVDLNDKHVSRVLRYDRAYPGSHICLLFENQRVQEIRVEYIRTDDIPDHILGVEKVIAGMSLDNVRPVVKPYVFPNESADDDTTKNMR